MVPNDESEMVMGLGIAVLGLGQELISVLHKGKSEVA